MHPLFDEVYFFEKIGSTSKQAENLIRSKTASGNFLVIARKQTGGVGRNRNRWFSPEGGLWFTAAFYGLYVPDRLTLFAGMCIHQALCELFPELKSHLKIKWPNDIYLNTKKLCGILATHQESEKYHLLGIGINSNNQELSEELSESAISLKKYFGRDVDNELIAKTIFDSFVAKLPAFIEGDFDFAYYQAHSLLMGREITLDTDFEQFHGVCHGINKNGAILIELPSGIIQPFFAGSVIEWG